MKVLQLFKECRNRVGNRRIIRHLTDKSFEENVVRQSIFNILYRKVITQTIV